MKIDKAIEILYQTRIPLKTAADHDTLDAIMLGIDALKRIKLHRTDRRYPFNTLLPGETPEEDRHAGNKANTGG